MTTAKVIEIIGSSTKSWEDAVQQALNEAHKTLKGIHGVDVIRHTTKVDNNGRIQEYRVDCKVAFEVLHK